MTVGNGILLLFCYLIGYRQFWRRHKRKVYITLGVVGSGYFLYKLYEAHRRKLSDLERELASERENDELIKAQLRISSWNIASCLL